MTFPKSQSWREEFITTLKREEIPDEMIIHKSNEAINTESKGINDTVNFGVNETQKQILKFISENSQITAGEMAYKMKQTKRNVM